MRYRRNIPEKYGAFAEFSRVYRPTRCCGLYSIQDIFMGETGESLMFELLEKYVRSTKRKLGFIATLTSLQIIMVFLEFGFREIKRFRNPNTGNTVVILFYQNGDENA